MLKHFAFLLSSGLIAVSGVVPVLGQPPSTPATNRQSTTDSEAAELKLDWEPAFSPISGSESKSKLIVLLITNDDPFAETPEDSTVPVVWCDDIFTMAYRKAMRSRPELAKTTLLQKQAAGLPSVLTKAVPRNQPARAMTFVTDSQYRLLAMAVGVPGSDDLMTLLEDAQDTAMVRQQNAGDRARVTKLTAERSGKRLNRQWNTVLKQMTEVINNGDVGDEGQVVETKASLAKQIARVGESLEQTYLADVRLRFAFSESADLLRLTILEQHPEARSPWCNAIMPFVVGRDLHDTWRSLVELVWKTTPVIDGVSDRELIDWWSAKRKTGTVVLALDPPGLAKLQKWPPVQVGLINKRNDWSLLEKEMAKHAFRTVNAQQLAILMRDRKLDPIELNGPSRLRYILFEQRRSSVTPVYESDFPSKFVGKLKRD